MAGLSDTLSSQPRAAPNPKSSEGEGNGMKTVSLSEYPIPVRHQGRSNNGSLPNITERMVPTRHSSLEPKLGIYGIPDPLGVHEMFTQVLRDTVEDEKIRRTHRVPPVPGSEEEKLQKLRDKWFNDCEDILRKPPDGLPPWRVVNHRIPIIDDKKEYKYYKPQCPDAVRDELETKLKRYTDALWWQRRNTAVQAAPLMCVLKKDGKIRTVVDCRQRNDNTVKDLTPLPDQDQIRMDVARAKYRSKIDLSDAYEQVRIIDEDVDKTAFATPFGVFVSYVMQQGDCNAPATFQRLMSTLFGDFIGRFVHVYLDDIFVFSDSIEDHERHLKLVFDKLREQKLYLSRKKCDLYSKWMDCLGHVVDDRGLHADADKLERIRNWRTPRSYHEVQRFLGLVNYLSAFMPNVSAYTSPLSEMEHNERAFVWRPLHQKCFDMIKALVCKAPILKPIDPKVDKPIWLICDASIHGVGALYGQGDEWKTCRPAGFHSRKFTSAQRAYPTYEQEALAILEGLMKWEDRLLGRKFTIVTDHKSLEFFKNAPNPSPRRMRWLEYMARFDFDVVHVPGEENKVADCLSRYYENDREDEVHPIHEYVNTDIRLDPDFNHLPQGRVEELLAGRVTRLNPEGLDPGERDRKLREKKEPRVVEADEMAAAAAKALAAEQAEPEPVDDGPAPLVGDSMGNLPSLRTRIESKDGFMKSVKDHYEHDPIFGKVLLSPSAYKEYVIHEGFIYTRNRMGESVLCLPHGKLGKRWLTQIAIDIAHETVGHFGPHKTSEYVRRWFWWPKLGKDVDKFCISCQKCQVSKPRNSLIAGLLHKLPTPLYP